MKNTKAVFLIILGSFIIATGFAFAVESETYNNLAAKGDPWGTRSAIGDLPVPAGAAAPAPAPVVSAPASAPAPAAVVPAPAAAPAAAPAKEKTFGEKMKEFLGKNMATMAMVGIGAYVGFALMGPVGILMGGLFMFGLMYLGNL